MSIDSLVNTVEPKRNHPPPYRPWPIRTVRTGVAWYDSRYFFIFTFFFHFLHVMEKQHLCLRTNDVTVLRETLYPLSLEEVRSFIYFCWGKRLTIYKMQCMNSLVSVPLLGAFGSLQCIACRQRRDLHAFSSREESIVFWSCSRLVSHSLHRPESAKTLKQHSCKVGTITGQLPVHQSQQTCQSPAISFSLRQSFSPPLNSIIRICSNTISHLATSIPIPTH